MEIREERKPFYKTAGKGKLYEQEAPILTDRGLIYSYYPETSAYVQAYVEDACDRLDYEGSFIYDEYPDKWTIERTCREICRQIQDSISMETMEKRGRRLDMGILGELAGALFCQEMHCRRCRRKRCRRFF